MEKHTKISKTPKCKTKLFGLTIVNSNPQFYSENNNRGKAGSRVMHILTKPDVRALLEAKKGLRA